MRCLAHGFPTPLARWHFHDEYELHLIVATRGKVFVGDWIGPFEPGHLVLCGPRLPHNWISVDLPDGGVAERDLVIQFRARAAAPRRRVDPRAGRGAAAARARAPRHRVLRPVGARAGALATHQEPRTACSASRVSATSSADLARCTDYRLLSSVQMQGFDDDAALDAINGIVDHITRALARAAVDGRASPRELGMSESRFSRFFRRATGNTFTDFVNRLRINRACQLLMETDRYIANICYDVGFNNVANFNRRFLEIKGMTPREFRRQSRPPLRRLRAEEAALMYLGLDLGTSELKALLLAPQPRDRRRGACAAHAVERRGRCGRSRRRPTGGTRSRP